jgi:hypothetical protein
MKKKAIILSTLFVLFFYKTTSVSAQWATYDVGLNPLMSAEMTKANTALAEQLTKLTKANETLLKTQGYTEEHLKIVQKYAEYLKTPNTELSATGYNGTGKYSGVYITYGAVIKTMNNIGFLNDLVSYDGQTFFSTQAGIPMDVSLFMSAVKTEAENIIAKVTDIKTANKFQMTDGERINLINSYEKEMQLLLGAAQVYVIRAQRVVIGMKSAAKDDNQLFNNL